MAARQVVEHGPAPSHRVPRPVMRHDWRTVTFLHWPYPPEAVQRLLPQGLRVETRRGAAWVGLVSFRITIMGPMGPPLPWLRGVPETNVRTYVLGPDGRPGVWFLSLDIAHPGAVLAARAGWGLPYFWSRMSVKESGGAVTYRSRRLSPGQPASLVGVQAGEALDPEEVGEFEQYLTARFGLWSRWLGRLSYTPAVHPPWPLRAASLSEMDDGLVAAAGLPAPGGDPLVHFSLGVPVRIGRPRLAAAVTAATHLPPPAGVRRLA